MNAIWYAIARVAAQDAADLRQGKPIRQGAGVPERWLRARTLADIESVSHFTEEVPSTSGG